MTEHIHARLMRLYYEDALETEKPWEMWQFRTKMGNWVNCNRSPRWKNNWEYRRKQTININGFDVPEPMREAPKIGTRFYFVSFTWRPDENHVDSVKWDGNAFDRALIKTGTCHSTKKTAEIHAKALLSFTEQK